MNSITISPNDLNEHYLSDLLNLKEQIVEIGKLATQKHFRYEYVEHHTDLTADDYIISLQNKADQMINVKSFLAENPSFKNRQVIEEVINEVLPECEEVIEHLTKTKLTQDSLVPIIGASGANNSVPIGISINNTSTTSLTSLECETTSCIDTPKTSTNKSIIINDDKCNHNTQTNTNVDLNNNAQTNNDISELPSIKNNTSTFMKCNNNASKPDVTDLMTFNTLTSNKPSSIHKNYNSHLYENNLNSLSQLQNEFLVENKVSLISLSDVLDRNDEKLFSSPEIARNTHGNENDLEFSSLMPLNNAFNSDLYKLHRHNSMESVDSSDFVESSINDVIEKDKENDTVCSDAAVLSKDSKITTNLSHNESNQKITMAPSETLSNLKENIELNLDSKFPDNDFLNSVDACEFSFVLKSDDSIDVNNIRNADCDSKCNGNYCNVVGKDNCNYQNLNKKSHHNYDKSNINIDNIDISSKNISDNPLTRAYDRTSTKSFLYDVYDFYDKISTDDLNKKLKITFEQSGQFKREIELYDFFYIVFDAIFSDSENVLFTGKTHHKLPLSLGTNDNCVYFTIGKMLYHAFRLNCFGFFGLARCVVKFIISDGKKYVGKLEESGSDDDDDDENDDDYIDIEDIGDDGLKALLVKLEMKMDLDKHDKSLLEVWLDRCHVNKELDESTVLNKLGGCYALGIRLPQLQAMKDGFNFANAPPRLNITIISVQNLSITSSTFKSALVVLQSKDTKYSKNEVTGVDYLGQLADELYLNDFWRSKIDKEDEEDEDVASGGDCKYRQTKAEESYGLKTLIYFISNSIHLPHTIFISFSKVIKEPFSHKAKCELVLPLGMCEEEMYLDFRYAFMRKLSEIVF